MKQTIFPCALCEKKKPFPLTHVIVHTKCFAKLKAERDALRALLNRVIDEIESNSLAASHPHLAAYSAVSADTRNAIHIQLGHTYKALGEEEA